MIREQPRIISDSTKAQALPPIGDVAGHHRYYGSSAIHGERIAESRRGPHPHSLNVCSF